jgi:hypothetical protein
MYPSSPAVHHLVVTDAGSVVPAAGPREPPRPQPSALAVNEYFAARTRLMNWMADPRRNLDHEFGWPEGGVVDTRAYQEMHDTSAIASRVTRIWPRECWQVQPSIYEDEDADVLTPFEEAWEEVGRWLRGGESAYEDADEGGHPALGYMARLDEQSGIGSYGVLLLGLDDGRALSEPADLDAAGGRKLLYLRVFPESLASVAEFESDEGSPRFGQPTAYRLTFNDPHQSRPGMGVSGTLGLVHWTRILHVADNLEGSEVFGVSRMRAVYNHLLDLRKLYGASAEMYYRGAFGGLSLETTQPDVEIDRPSLKTMMEERNNGLQRDLLLENMTAKSLAPQVVDPTPQIMAHLQAICVALEVPMRIFMGSERGELASSDDRKDMANKARGRRRRHCSPRIVVPFVDRLIALGVLPRPERYCVWWPDAEAQGETEQADVALKRTQALAQYVQSGAEAVMSPAAYLSRVQGWTEDEAAAVVEEAAGLLEEAEEEAAALAAEVAAALPVAVPVEQPANRNGNGRVTR